jgi:tRNA threonylcarbamoyladenosine dehydratase
MAKCYSIPHHTADFQWKFKRHLFIIRIRAFQWISKGKESAMKLSQLSPSSEPIDGFLDRTVRMMGTEALLALRHKRVAIAGCGGVGGAIAIALARFGLRKFTLADPGLFDPPDMNRQSGAFNSTMGRNKAEVYDELVHDIQPKAEVIVYREGVTEENVSAFLEGADLLIDSLDIAVPGPLRMKVYELAHNHHISGISAPIIGMGALIVSSTPGGIPLTVWGEFLAAAASGSNKISLPDKIFSLFAAPHVEALERALAERKAPSNAVATLLATSVTCTEAVMILAGPLMPGWRPNISLPKLIAVDLAKLNISITDMAELSRPAQKYTALGAGTVLADGRQQRERILKRAGYNVNLLPHESATIDCYSDSFPELGLELPEVVDSVTSEIQPEEFIRRIYGYKFVVTAAKGRFAEALLTQAMIKPGTAIAVTSLFPTTKFHLESRVGRLVHLGVSDGVRGREQKFAGNIDLVVLEKAIEAELVQAIYIELCNNALGGAPVSMENLQQTHEIASKRKIPIILDSTRAFENAALIKQRESGYADRTLVGIVNEICLYSDACTSSLTKDFVAPAGAFIGMRSSELMTAVSDLSILAYGNRLPTSYQKALSQALSLWHDGDSGAAGRIETVQQLADMLVKLGIPMFQPVGGHAIIVNAGKLLTHVPMNANPAATLCAALLAVGGVRASVHLTTPEQDSAGMSLVRLAIPIGASRTGFLEHIPKTFERLIAEREQWKGLEYSSPIGPGLLAALTAGYRRL